MGTALLVWLGGLFPDWSPLLPYMADGTAQYAEKVVDTQQSGSYGDEGVHRIPKIPGTEASLSDVCVPYLRHSGGSYPSAEM